MYLRTAGSAGTNAPETDDNAQWATAWDASAASTKTDVSMMNEEGAKRVEAWRVTTR